MTFREISKNTWFLDNGNKIVEIYYTKVDKTKNSGYIIHIFEEESGQEKNMSFFARTKRDVLNTISKLKRSYSR